MRPVDSMSQRLRISGMFVIIGLLVEALCLVWSKPIAFVVLVCIGGTLIGLGVLFFLYSLVTAPAHATDSSGAATDK
jgi:RsiW-degrading membrane proteinase PrsW (M82 family)